MDKSSLFFVCSCLLFIRVFTDSECPVVLTPASVIVPYGGAFIANCSATNQSYGMGWESPVGGVDLQQKATHVLLDIKNLNTWELISTCYINYNSEEEQCTKRLNITIYKMPESVFIESETTAMEEHKEYKMKCTVNQVTPVKNVKVAWYKENMLIQEDYLTDVPGEGPHNQTTILKITGNRQDHGKKLDCKAKFDFVSTSESLPVSTSPSLDLQVLYQPVFEKASEEYEVSTNDKISLNCTTQGNPIPDYHWEVPQLSDQKVVHYPVLTLQKPVAGTYNCTASNSQGSSIKQFVIKEAPRDYTVLAAVVGVPAVLGALFLLSGPFIVTQDGTFSLNKGYTRGQPI